MFFKQLLSNLLSTNNVVIYYTSEKYLPILNLLPFLQIGYAAMDTLSTLKLIDAGVSKDNITIIATLISTIQIILPLFVSKYTSGRKPMNLFLTLTPIRYLLANNFKNKIRFTEFTGKNVITFILTMACFRILWNLPYAAFVFYTQFVVKSDSNAIQSLYYNLTLGFISITSEVSLFCVLFAQVIVSTLKLEYLHPK